MTLENDDFDKFNELSQTGFFLISFDFSFFISKSILSRSLNKLNVLVINRIVVNISLIYLKLCVAGDD